MVDFDPFPGHFTSTGPNQFLVRAAGGVGINTNAPSPGRADGSGHTRSGTLTFGSVRPRAR